jgi:ATP-dependent protease ClpP protease subunit
MQYRERVIFFGNRLMKNLVINYWQQCCMSTLKITHKLYLYINGPGGDVSNDYSVNVLGDQ